MKTQEISGAHLQDIISLARFGGIELQPQSIVVALNDDLVSLIRTLDSELREKGDNLDLGAAKKIVQAFLNTDKEEKEPVLEK